MGWHYYRLKCLCERLKEVYAELLWTSAKFRGIEWLSIDGSTGKRLLVNHNNVPRTHSCLYIRLIEYPTIAALRTS